MNSKVPVPDKAFIQRQRQRLTRIRDELLRTTQAKETEETAIHSNAAGEAREYEDDAQKLTLLELEGNLSAADDERLSNIERALKKIDEGSYGLSDGSGAPIPIERLEASPEALYTLEEQASRDVRR